MTLRHDEPGSRCSEAGQAAVAVWLLLGRLLEDRIASSPGRSATCIANSSLVVIDDLVSFNS